MTETITTINLPKYGGREGRGKFEVLRNIEEVTTFCNAASHIWIVGLQGDARRVKVNGAVRRWKRDASRIEIPVKYGMYEYATLTADDVRCGRILRYIGEV